MKFRKKLEIFKHVEITSMVDVVFLLVTYFLMFSSLADESTAIEVNLPDSKQSKAVEVPERIIISVDSSSKIFIGDSKQPVTIEKLGDAVLKIMEEGKSAKEKKNIIIRGDEKSQYKTIIAVMDELSLRGLKNFNLSVHKKAGNDAL